MDDITRAHYEGKFKVAFLTAKGDEFQTLFERLMGQAHPADFIPCRPWGSAGDRKNDGYLSSERTLFQAYAPNEMSATEAIAKIDEDFKGALPHWAQYFEKWVFVHNAHDGLSPQIIAKLLELQRQHPPLKLTHWSLEELRQRLQRIPLDGLQSLFGFAPTVQSALPAATIEKLGHLAPSTLPFVRVREAAGIYGSDDDPGAFSPSLREFEDKLVHRPALAEQVQTALLDRRFACLLGKGASGKTTLALLLAFGETFGPEQSYYFDLAETEDEPDAAESYRAAMQAIARQHGRDALVIVDNIHLAEGLAHKLHLAWREAGQPVRLLLQGRFTQPGADRRGRHSPLEELKRTALVLEVMLEDLAGVLQRLVRRFKENPSISVIPPAVLDQWLKVFGGELIAFSSAARRKLPQILRGQYQLTEAEAADYIREEYLENQELKRRIDSAERENLIAIAACANWEVPMPAEALPHPSASTLAVSMKRGLVWQSIHGRYGQFERYRLCHPGMGKLLWAAARPAKSKLDYACELGQRYPFFGDFVASRLLRVDGDREGAKRVSSFAISSADAFERIIENGMVRLRTRCRQLTMLGVLPEGELNQRLATCRNLTQSALATPLGDLAEFLEYAQTKLPTVWQAVAEALAKEENRQTLAQSALATPLADLAIFLACVQSKLPTVWQAVAEALAKKQNSKTLTHSALVTPLADLANFLRYAQTELPTAWQEVAETLAKEENRQTLTQSALATSLNDLADFLKYAQTNLPTVRQTLAGALATEENRQTLVQSALATPLDGLANFLKYAQTNVPVVWQTLAEALAKEENRQTLARTALATPLDYLANFLKYAQTELPKDPQSNVPVVWQVLAEALAKEENRQVLAQTALASPLNHLSSFLEYAQSKLPTVWQAVAEALEQDTKDTKNSALFKSVLAQPVTYLANFLKYAQTQLPPVWQALAEALAKEEYHQSLAQSALATPLHYLANFLKYAQTEMPTVWQALADALAKHADRLSENGRNAALNDLVGFAHHAPVSLFEIVVREITPGHWNSTPVSKGLNGATWLAWKCPNVNRDDLATDLMTLLLRRANWRDFPTQWGGFEQVCLFLAIAPSSAAELVEPFLKAVRTDKWLQVAYAATSCGQLASGLRRLAFHQSVERCRQFHHKSLGSRLNKELGQFETAAPSEQSEIIQLLGCAGLCGWAVSQRSLASITLGTLSQLPLSILPHRPEATEVEDHQIQLWLGLRAFVSITRERLPLPREPIEETLKLWRANLGETASTPTTAAHRVNQSMAAWLETCLRVNPPALVPSEEPLWTLAGFPLRLDLPKPPRSDFRAT